MKTTAKKTARPALKGTIKIREPYARTATEKAVKDLTPAEREKYSHYLAGERDGDPTSGLKDSGARAASVTGGLHEPKPADLARYDLIPYECLARAMSKNGVSLTTARLYLYHYLAGERDGDPLAVVIGSSFCACGGWDEGMRRLAVLYGRGAIKYAERNWEKGIETHQRVLSLQRHFTKALRGDTDEDHIAAIAWNACALMYYETRIADGRLPRELDTYGLVK